jgi:hypothetical protein
VDRSLDQISDDLYILPPQGFTAARDAYATQARTDGDPGLAKQLAALKRPTLVGFLVNAVALRHPEALDRLLALAGRMTADRTVLRDLSAARRRELDTLLALATELAEETGLSAPTRNQLAEVEATLSAALVDEATAALVRSGRVLKAVSYGGFAGFAGPASGDTATGVASISTEATSDEASKAEAREQAQRVLDEARTALEDARTAETALRGEAEALAASIEELKARLDTVSAQARAARQTRLTAERELASAQRRRDRLD